MDTLIQARTKHLSNNNSELVPVTAVGVSHTPGQSDLPSVKEELKQVTSAFQGHKINVLLNSEATVGNVLHDIKSSAWVHLACHALQDPIDPLKSGLLLHDGVLGLQQILETNLPYAKFIFLSACETAMGDEKLRNESMHLTGAFMAAGFHGAIGTLWSMSDSDGPQVAEIVYKKVNEGGTPDVTLTAEGLHLAIQHLQQRGAPFQKWIPFIHVGI